MSIRRSRRSAVIGVPTSDLAAEVGKCAASRCGPRASADAAGILAWCREHMANYKVPRHVGS